MNKLIVEQAVAAVEAARRQPLSTADRMAQARAQVTHALRQEGHDPSPDEVEVAISHEMIRHGDDPLVHDAPPPSVYLQQRWFTTAAAAPPSQKPLGEFLATPKPLGDKLPE